MSQTHVVRELYAHREESESWVWIREQMSRRNSTHMLEIYTISLGTRLVHTPYTEQLALQYWLEEV